MECALAEHLKEFGCEMHVAPGELILNDNAPVQGVYIVDAGNVCTSLVNDDGVPVWSQTKTAGAILGLASAIAKSAHMVRVVALEPTVLSYIPAEKLVKLILDNPVIVCELLPFLCREKEEMQSQWTRLAGMRRVRKSFSH